MEQQTTVTVAYGDGIGPEIMEAVLRILKEAKAKLNFETIEIGEKIYNQGYSSGIAPHAWETIRKNKIVLKAPITTPQGKGVKSLNVTLRKALGLYANIRPVVTIPFLNKTSPHMDLVIFRENEEDLYSGIEYRITNNTALSFKLITKQGSERIIRSAFEYAKAQGRKKVTCITKDNIMKIADGIFHNIFREVSAEFPGIEADHMIVDIGSAKVASKPSMFDVIVTLNLYGDIISDIAAEVSGSVGLAGSANIGNGFAMFEAVHGSAPDIAGLNIANPSGLLNATIMMLEHIGHYQTAHLIKAAWLKTLEDGIHTKDIFIKGSSKELASTTRFTDAIAKNLGQQPKSMEITPKSPAKEVSPHIIQPFKHHEKLVGVDIYTTPHNQQIKKLVHIIEDVCKEQPFILQNISENGLAIWPTIIYEEFHTEFPRLRFMATNKQATYEDIIALQQALLAKKIPNIMSAALHSYDDMAGFTKAQGE